MTHDDEHDGTAADDPAGGGMTVDLQLQHEVVAVQVDTELHLLVELTLPPAAVDADRQPLRLALVVDRSGSMRGARLNAATQAAHQLVDHLAQQDQLALISYDSAVQLLAPLGPIDKSTLHAAIDGIHAGGTTNLSGGWLKGAQELRKATEGLQRVLLLSDGHANEGITQPARLREMASSLGRDGIGTTTIGFGDGFDEDLLVAMADAGRGTAHFAESPDDAPAIFAEEFDDLVSVAAQNVTLSLRPTRDVSVIEVLNTYPSVPTPNGVQVEVGDAFAGQTMRVVCTLHVPAIAQLGLASVGEVEVRWIGIDDQVTEHVVTQPLVVNAVSAEDAAGATPNPAVEQEATILAAGKAAAEARDMADRGDLQAARALVERTRRSLADVPEHHVDLPSIRQSMLGIDTSLDAMAGGTYDAADSKRLLYESRKLRSRKRRPDA